MRSILASAALALTLAGFVAPADAAPITYEFSGIGTGSLDGTAFTDALVIFTGTADTTNVELVFGGVIYAILLDTLTVNIAGVGTATLTEPAGIWGFPFAVPDEIDIDDELPDFPFVLLGRLDDPPDLNEGFTGIAATATNALAGYNLTTAIGPIVGAGGVGFNENCGGTDPCLATSEGLLLFTHNIESGGTFTATLQDVPEPATLLLMGGGLAAFVRRSRRVARR